MDNQEQQYKHLHKDKLCFHCNNLQHNIKIYSMGDRIDEESLFDGDRFNIHLCSHCIDKLKVKEDWFNNDIAYNEDTDTYDFEQNIVKLIKGFPICNQEYCLNIDNEVIYSRKIDREDWINIIVSNS
ncbi:MAG: hypothetical protein ACRCVJ_11905 [Clostridium sp.]|uniref:hypothetical protein n=1 Tax=Clostridium sp. TaxID=1506 RepID=UPI003F3D528F